MFYAVVTMDTNPRVLYDTVVLCVLAAFTAYQARTPAMAGVGRCQAV